MTNSGPNKSININSVWIKREMLQELSMAPFNSSLSRVVYVGHMNLCVIRALSLKVQSSIPTSIVR